MVSNLFLISIQPLVLLFYGRVFVNVKRSMKPLKYYRIDQVSIQQCCNPILYCCHHFLSEKNKDNKVEDSKKKNIVPCFNKKQK